MSGAGFREWQTQLDGIVSEVKSASKCSAVTKNDANALAGRCLHLIKTFQLENGESEAEPLLSLSNLQSFNYLMKFVSSVCLYSGLAADKVPNVNRIDADFVNLCKICDGSLRSTTIRTVEEVLKRRDQLSRALTLLPIIADCLYLQAAVESSPDLHVRRFLELLPTQIVYETLLSVIHWTRKPQLQSFFSSELTNIPTFKQDAIYSLLTSYADLTEGEFVEVSSSQLDEIAKAFIVVPAKMSPKEYYTRIAEQSNAILSSPMSPQKVVNVLLAVLARVEALKPGALKQQRDLLVSPFESNTNIVLQPCIYVLSNFVTFDFPLALHVYLRCLPALWSCYVYLKAQNCDVSLLESIFNSVIAKKKQSLEGLVNVFSSPSYLCPKFLQEGSSADLVLVDPSKAGYDRSDFTEMQIKFVFELILKYDEQSVTTIVCYLLEQLLRGCGFNQGRAQAFQNLLAMLFDKIDLILKNNLNRLLQVITTVIKRVLRESGAKLCEEDVLLLDTCFTLARQIIEEAVIKAGGDQKVDTSSLNDLLPYCTGHAMQAQKIEDLISLSTNCNNDFGGEAKEGDSVATLLGIAKQSVASPFVPIKAYGVSLLKKVASEPSATLVETSVAIDILISQLGEDDAFVHVAAQKALGEFACTNLPACLLKLAEALTAAHTGAAARAKKLLKLILEERGSELDCDISEQLTAMLADVDPEIEEVILKLPGRCL